MSECSGKDCTHPSHNHVVSDTDRVPQQLQEPLAPSPEVMSFHERYHAAMLIWAKDHKNMNFPVVETDNGKLKWINRAARRAAQKQAKRRTRP